MTTKTQILKDIRAKCIDCCVYQISEVRKCHLSKCALWPYRMGKDPYPSPPRGVAKSSLHRTGLKQCGQVDGRIPPTTRNPPEAATSDGLKPNPTIAKMKESGDVKATS